jgi:hypothetical protein
MRFACWITKATDRHSEYVILIDFRRQKLFRERASMLRHRYAVCLVLFTAINTINFLLTFQFQFIICNTILNIRIFRIILTHISNDTQNKQQLLFPWTALKGLPLRSKTSMLTVRWERSSYISFRKLRLFKQLNI